MRTQLGLNVSERPPKRRRDSNSSDDSHDSHSHGRTIKVKNLLRFTENMTFQRRKEWFQDLQRAFLGDPKRYETESNRILFALDQMDAQPRNRWYSHCGNLSDSERHTAETTWKHFEDWTQTCINDWANLVSTAAKKFNKAQQYENQSPVEFHHYLESLEDQFPHKDDKTRALDFYTKLSDPVLRHIDTYHPQRPETREGIVRLATQVWETLRPHRRNRQHTESSPHTPYSSNYRPRNAIRGRHNPANERGNHPYQHDGPDHRHHNESGPDHHRDPPDSTMQEHDNVLRCYICNSDQHLANNCPEKGKSLNQASGYPRRGFRYSRGNRRGNGQRPR